MSGNDDIRIERLRSARIFGVHGEPETVVLQVTGATGTEVNFGLTPAELGQLGQRLIEDAITLMTRPPTDERQ